MPPTWLTILSGVSLVTAFACAAWILWDLFGRGHRQPMRIMEVVWPLTALYAGPLAVWGYQRLGRPRSARWQAETGSDPPSAQSGWASVALSVGHCGSGCTLGDVVAESLVFWLSLTIAGTTLYAAFVADFVFALAFGIIFQYFAITTMRDLGVRKGLYEAARADVLSLTAFEVGMFGWMAVVQLVLFPDPHLNPTQPAFWFAMQIAMLVGFATAWPANVWLLRRGVKEAM